MAAICAMEQWRERIEANPANGEYLTRLPARQFIEVLTRWNEIFVAGAQHPVMGVSPEELRAIKAPTIIIPGNDKTHSLASGLAAHRLIAGSTLHRLPIEDQDEPMIPFPQWSPYEPEIARVFAEFMKQPSLAKARPLDWPVAGFGSLLLGRVPISPGCERPCRPELLRGSEVMRCATNRKGPSGFRVVLAAIFWCPEHCQS